MKEEIKVGSRVRYIGCSRPEWLDKTGTIVAITGACHHILFDGDSRTCYVSNAFNLRLLSEVEQALSVLKKHGTVTFVPAFKPITVKLNEEYEAVVHETFVKVGCQEFTFDRVLVLAEAVQTAINFK